MSLGYSIDYLFTPMPEWLTRKVFRESGNLSKNQILTLWGIADEILRYPDARGSLMKELACRYLGRKIGLHYTAVAAAVRKLANKGFIEIVEIGKKKVGSLIRLINDCMDEHVKEVRENKGNSLSVDDLTTDRDSSVVETNTNNSTLVVETATKIESSIKKIDQEKTDDSFLSEKAIKTAGNILQKNGISNIADIVKNIADYMFNHKNIINNPDAYLVSSCKNYGKNGAKNLLPAAGHEAESDKEVVVRKDSFAGTFEGWEKEKSQEVDYLEAVEILKSSFPKEYERVEGIVSEKLKGQKFVFSVDRARRIVEEFRAVYRV